MARGQPPVGFNNWSEYDSWIAQGGLQQQKARDTATSAAQAAQTAQNQAQARQQGLAGDVFTTGTGATGDVGSMVWAQKASMQDPANAWANATAHSGMVAEDSAAKRIAAAPSFSGTPSTESGPSGFKSFSEENSMASYVPGGVKPISPGMGGGAQKYTGQPMNWAQQPQNTLSTGNSDWRANAGGTQNDWNALSPEERAKYQAGGTNPTFGADGKPLFPQQPVGTGGGGMPQIQPQQGGTGGFPWNPAIGTVNTGTPGTMPTQQNTPQLDPAILQSFYGGQQSPGGTAIDPNNSLRGQQFLPGGTQNSYDQQALAALNATQGGQVQNQWDQQAWNALNSTNMPTEFSPMVGETRDMIMDRLRGLGGPDRTQLAQEAFDIFQAQNEPRYQQELRGVGQKAAALGRVGAGMTTNDLTGVWGQRNRELDLLQRSLINDAAGQTLNDRLNTLNATIGGSSTLEGQDFNRQNAALQSAFQRAGMAGQFGQNQFGREQANAGLGLDRAGILAGMGQDQFGREKSNYQQNSQERQYQDYLARTALEDRIRQQQMEQEQAQREWERQYAANQLAAQLARGQDSQFPGIAQPRGDSFGTGVAAGTQNPVLPPSQPTTPVLPPSNFDVGPYAPPDPFLGNPELVASLPPSRRGIYGDNPLYGDTLGLGRLM